MTLTVRVIGKQEGLYKRGVVKSNEEYLRTCKIHPFPIIPTWNGNKHHEFEHLARQFARLRICENILPATGPVSAGGDQGHDFETYKSYLSATPIATSTFLGWTREKKFVFACSLQDRKKIASKIKADVKTICVASHTIHGIYYFCEADLPVAKRHELSSWCQQTFNAELEIFDGTDLAEQLTNLDVFWIAEQYLQVPSELFPRSTTADSTYESYKERWLTGDPKPYSFGDFFRSNMDFGGQHFRRR
jgi:hypothetical protein